MAAKRYLAIETSSPRLSLAIGSETSQLASYHGPHDWRHAESLFEGIQKLLKKARWTVKSLSGVAVCLGPGSFTGIRIGLACARAMGQSLRIPVVGISSLELLAAGARTSAEWLAPQIDALRGQRFTALFQKESSGVRRVIPEGIVDSSAWPTLLRKKTKKGRVWHSNLQKDFPDAEILLKFSRPRLKIATEKSYTHVLPLYIRRAAAEERRG